MLVSVLVKYYKNINNSWYRWSESNRHARKEHTILSRACLPIPPQRLDKNTRTRLFTGVCIIIDIIKFC